jgi:pimeloyl-ACP methyl ester carboxylesterase
VCWLWLALTACPVSGTEVSAQGAAGHVVQKDAASDCDLWLISTRHLACFCTTPEAAPEYEIERYDQETGWESSNLAALLADGDFLTTVIYVHGNRIETDEVRQQAWQVCDGFERVGPGGARMRIVIWSWPSGQVHGQLQDIRVKAQRTLCEGYYMAYFLSQLGRDRRLSLVGYSFGARIVASALHLLSGGTIRGQQLSVNAEQAPERVRVAVLAAAVERGTLDPGGVWSRAWLSIDELLVLVNPLDPVLKRFWLVDLRSKPKALGYAGMPTAHPRAEQIDASCYVGRTHQERAYLGNTAVMRLLAQFVLDWDSDQVSDTDAP